MRLPGAKWNYRWSCKNSGSDKKDVEKMALSTIGGKFKGVISKDQDLLDAAKHGNVEAIGKLTAKKRQSTASQFLPR